MSTILYRSEKLDKVPNKLKFFKIWEMFSDAEVQKLWFWKLSS